jgi:glucose/mannose-6-phosphate isomerase
MMSLHLGLDLDSPSVLATADPQDMRALIEGLPEQIEQAWRAGLEWPLPSGLRAPGRVLVAGVGGSAIGGDIVAALAMTRSLVPVQVLRGYESPPLDGDALLVASSFSGETRETLAAVTSPGAEAAMRLAITSGGALAALAVERGWPAFCYAFDGPPRSALGWGTFPLLAILSRLGALATSDGDVAAAVHDLRQAGSDWVPAVLEPANLAKQLAGAVAGRAVLVIGAAALEAAARRWAGQLNENAKQWALWAALPEADHNLIIALEGHPAGEQPHVVLLDAVALQARDREHVALTAETLAEAGVPYEVVTLQSSTLLGALIEACHLADWVSLYAAVLNGVDPMSVEALARFKLRLAARAPEA